MYIDDAVLRRMLHQRPGALIYGGSRQGSVYITSSAEEFFECTLDVFRFLCKLSVNAGAEGWQARGCVGLAGLWIQHCRALLAIHVNEPRLRATISREIYDR
jgi:hypothetical protein